MGLLSWLLHGPAAPGAEAEARVKRRCTPGRRALEACREAYRAEGPAAAEAACGNLRNQLVYCTGLAVCPERAHEYQLCFMEVVAKGGSGASEGAKACARKLKRLQKCVRRQGFVVEAS